MGFYWLCLALGCLGLSWAVSSHGVCPSGVHTKNTTLFGSKTGYENVAYYDDDPLDSEGCTAKAIWMLIRHGARNPDEELIESMLTRLVALRDEIVRNGNEGKGSLCSKGLHALKDWKLEITKEEENFLVPSGLAEQTALGGRWRARMGTSFTSPFDSQDYLIRATPTQRTKESARGFVQGFFSRNNAVKVKIEVVDEGDPVLKPYKTCKKFIETVDDNPATYKEREKFFNGEEMNKVLELVKERTGINDLEMDDVELMYEMLRYEESWEEGTTRLSPWRSVFSEDDIAVIRYLDDLQYYYRDGYWNDLSAKIACKTVEDMLQSLNENAALRKYPKGVFSFSHSGIILKLYSRLGLFKPSIAPNATNFGIPETKVRSTGDLDPFSSNIAVVLFSCLSSSEPDMVQIFVQEKPVSSQEICGLQKCSLKAFQDLVSRGYDCDINAFCSSGQNPASTTFQYLALGSVFTWLNLYLKL